MAYVAYLWPSRNTRLLTEFSIVVFILRSFRPFFSICLFVLFYCLSLSSITTEVLFTVWAIKLSGKFLSICGEWWYTN